MAALHGVYKVRERLRRRRAGARSSNTRASLDPSALKIWEWLRARYPEHRLTLESNPSLELGIDSLEWLQNLLEIERACGIRLDPAAIARARTVRELLERKPDSQVVRPWTIKEILDDPDQVIGGDDVDHWLRPLSAIELAAGRCIHALNWLLVRSYFPFCVEGLARLPKRGSMVIAPHHVSYLDAFMLGAAIEFRLLRQSYWAAWTGVAYGPIFRFLRRLTHIVPIDMRGGADINLAYGAAVLRRGHNLIWFPEGALSQTGGLMPLKPGLGVLLTRYPVPVVPVVVQGTREALPPGSKLPRPLPITVTFGEPLDPRDLEKSGSGELPHQRITNALFEVMARSCCGANTMIPLRS